MQVTLFQLRRFERILYCGMFGNVDRFAYGLASHLPRNVLQSAYVCLRILVSATS
jgi:hypothetical protein